MKCAFAINQQIIHNSENFTLFIDFQMLRIEI